MDLRHAGRRMAATGADRRAGMTIVELMVSLLIFGVIAAVIFGFLTESRRSYAATRQKAQYQAGMRAVMSLMSREIRSAGADPRDLGTFERFAVATDTQVRCRMDLNGDGDATDAAPDEDITYTFDGAAGTLTRTAGGVDAVVLRGLARVTFNYFDGDGNLLNAFPLNAVDRSLIRTVALGLGGETDKEEPVEYDTRILVRND